MNQQNESNASHADVLAMLAAVSLADPSQRPAFNAARAAVAELIAAADYARKRLLKIRSHTKPDELARLEAALAAVGGAA